MNTYNITFSHPVKGTAFFTDRMNKINKVVPVETDDDNVLKIPLDGLQKGKWTIKFEWEYNDREYDCNGKVTVS